MEAPVIERPDREPRDSISGCVESLPPHLRRSPGDGGAFLTARTLARRYAVALFDVVARTGGAERTSRDLSAVRALIADHDELRHVLTTPAVVPQKKRAILTAVLEAAGGASSEVTRLLFLLADRDRLMLLSEIADAFGERLRQAERVVPAEVTTAVPLGDARRSALAQAIGKAAGCRVTINERVDPSIIGGIIARVGSVVFDGSVARQLERLRVRLTES